jgi:hypothetical protein
MSGPKEMGRAIPKPKGQVLSFHAIPNKAFLFRVFGYQSRGFYRDVQVEKVEWWYSWCHNWPDLYFARLRTFSNGKADVLFENEKKSYGFDSEESAGDFIAGDEFSRLNCLDEEDRAFLEIPIDAVVAAPAWSDAEVSNFEYLGKY